MGERGRIYRILSTINIKRKKKKKVNWEKERGK